MLWFFSTVSFSEILVFCRLFIFWQWSHCDGDGHCCGSRSPSPKDPYVFGPPGSGFGSVRQRYGSGSFYHQAKIVRKTLIPTVLWLLYDFLSLKWCKCTFKKYKQKNSFVGILKVSDKNSRIWIHYADARIRGSGSVTKCHVSARLVMCKYRNH
jgi:hypothetical protein